MSCSEQSIELQRLINGESRILPRDRAGEFLQDHLADGRRSVQEVKEAAEKQGITEGTLKRTAKRLGIVRIREGNQFFMELPQPEPEQPIEKDEYAGLTPMDFEELPY